MKTFKIAVEWAMAGNVYVKAKSLEEAMKIASEDEDSTIGLPDDGFYIDGSWEVNKEMTKEYNET